MASSVASSSTSPLPLQAADKKQSSTQARNPVALRLYKVLSTNFEDAATREALQYLSDLYAPPSSSIKGKEPLKLDEDEDDIENGAAAGQSPVLNQPPVELVPGEIAARARKHLRRDMEKKLAEGSRQFLKALSEIDQVCVSFTLRKCVCAEQQCVEIERPTGAS
jgi:hypothetical protein